MKSTVSILILLVLGSATQASEQLMPSEITILANHALQASPGVDRKSVTGPLVARLVGGDDLSDIERFLKGEVHFLHLQPEEARDEFWAFRDRDDDLGRVAWQRLMVIRINGFRMIDDVLEKDIHEYNRRFGVREDDRYGISFPIQRVAQLLADRGEVDRALDLIVDHVRRHGGFDAPYSAYALPGQFIALAADHGREAEFRELNDWVLEGLGATIARRLSAHPKEGAKVSGIQGEVFFSLFADRRLDSYEWTAEFLKLRDRIVDGAASARRRPGQ